MNIFGYFKYILILFIGVSSIYNASAQPDVLPVTVPNGSRGFSKMYFTTDTGSDLYRVELDTLGGILPAPTSVPITLGGTPLVLDGEGAAYRSVDGKVYGFTGGVGASISNMYSIDVETGIATLEVGSIVPGHVRGAEFYVNNDTGEEILFIVYDGSPDVLTALNPKASGPNPAWSAYAGYPKNISGALTNPDGFAWDPVSNKFYVQNDNTVDFYSIDIATGITTFEFTSAFGVDGEGLSANADSKLYTEDENTNRIYRIDTLTGDLTEVAFSSGTGDVESMMGNFGTRDDAGDAPSTYGWAAHGLPVLTTTAPAYYLGSSFPDDEDPLNSFSAGVNDDADGDDEDGVFHNGTDLQQQSLSRAIPDSLTIMTNGSGFLNAWADWNGDGDFEDSGEQIATDLTPSGGSITLYFTAPANSILDTTYARFRYSSQSGLASNGTHAADGEVEDYQIIIEEYAGYRANNDQIYTNISTPVDVFVFDNDAGSEDTATLSVAGLLQPQNGTVVVDPSGFITYIPQYSFSGRDTFEYTACSNTMPIECDTARVEVIISCHAVENDMTISGVVFNDANENLQTDISESGQENIDVYLFYDRNGNGYIDNVSEQTAIDTTTTATNGTYEFIVEPVLGPVISMSSRISASSDDAEEPASGGTPDLTSSDLELSTEGSTPQIIGMRFNNINIPSNVIITSAYIEFETDETNNANPSNLIISGQDHPDPPTFTTATNNILNRPKTTNSVAWINEPNWTITSEKHESPDISIVIQEIIDSTAWSSGNSMVLLIEGTGRRTAESFNGESANAPILYIEYRTVEYPIDFVVQIDTSTLPANTFMTTDNIEQIQFTADGQSSCENNFGFQYFKDTDGDGIFDKDDLDDDNDGLRDVDEVYCSNAILPSFATLYANGTTVLPDDITVTATGFGVGTASPSFTSIGSLLEIEDDDTVVSDTDNVFRNYAVLRLAFDQPVLLTDTVHFYDVDFTQRVAMIGSLNGKLIPATHVAINNTTIETGYMGAFPAGLTDADPFQILVAGSGGTSNTLDGAAHINGQIIDNLYILWNVHDVYASLAHLRIGHNNVTICRTEADEDMDGISNHLDLDADGDGCFDANESGHSELVDVNGMIATSSAEVGANGLDNDVETDDSFSANINYTIQESAPGIFDFLNDSFLTGCYCPTATMNPHIMYYQRGN